MRNFVFIVGALLLVAAALEVASEMLNPDEFEQNEYNCDDCEIQMVRYQPEQVHLSFGECIQDIVVTWSTRDDTPESVCEYGINTYEYTISASDKSQEFVDGGKGKYTQFIHRVTLPDLNPNTSYVYHCGSTMGWSPEFRFRTPPISTDWSPVLAIYGDMGNENAQSLPRLQREAQGGLYDAILHVGDFAYDLHSNNAQVGDQFMEQIESIAAYVPYMVVPGNHEEAYNFSNYRARFTMPGGSENLYYSFNLGPVHFIGFSTEVYYFLRYGVKLLVNQYDWLEEDLIEANKPENRAKRPWIITFGHRPMYCSNANNDDCTKHETIVRTGLTLFGTYVFGLEDLFYNYNVDVEIWAHEHCYERFWPLYNYTILKGSRKEPYRNAPAPVHIITGSAGNKEGREPFIKKIPKWSAFHSQDYGYTRMKAYNYTHLYFEQVSDDQGGDIIDSFWIIKDAVDMDDECE